MRTTLPALLLAAAFVAAPAIAKADGSIENAAVSALSFATKGGAANVNLQRNDTRTAPVFTVDQTRGIVTNPAGSSTSGR
jgi:hypothetical protein